MKVCFKMYRRFYNLLKNFYTYLTPASAFRHWQIHGFANLCITRWGGGGNEFQRTQLSNEFQGQLYPDGACWEKNIFSVRRYFESNIIVMFSVKFERSLIKIFNQSSLVVLSEVRKTMTDHKTMTDQPQ